MAEVASAFVSLIPSARGFGRQIDSQIGPDLDKSGKSGGLRFGKGFAGSLKRVIGPAVALVGAAAVGSLLKSSIEEAREAQKVGALTVSIIKSTGGAAKITADQVGDLATAISLKSGMDDEAIQSGANLLLTFKNVRNEAGKGADVFDRATQAAVDLSAAGFGDLSGTSKQLGKALNDPVKGISALGRAGVTFTEGQKKRIKGFVKENDLLSAQKIILKEVESQVGGAAAATATSGEKMSVAFGNLKEQLGTALLPVVDKLAVYLTTKVVPALTATIAYLQKNPQILYGVAAAVGALAAAFVIAVVAANAIAFGIAAVVGGLVYAYTHFETFRNIVNTVFKFVSAYVKANIAIVSAVLRGTWSAISAVIGFLGSLKNGAVNAVDFVKTKFTSMVNFIKSIPGKIKNVFKGLWSGIAGGLKSALNSVLHLPITIPKINTHIPGVGTVGGQTLIPALAAGAKVTKPTLALIGEAGTEYVVPENRMRGLESLGSLGDSSRVAAIASPLDLSDTSIAALADAILAGAARVANGLDDRRDFTNTVKSRTPGAFAGSLS